MTEVFVL